MELPEHWDTLSDEEKENFLFNLTEQYDCTYLDIWRLGYNWGQESISF